MAKQTEITVHLADLDHVKTALAYLKWCHDEQMVPGDTYSAGCGCCSDPVEIPAEFRPVMDALATEVGAA